MGEDATPETRKARRKETPPRFPLHYSLCTQCPTQHKVISQMQLRRIPKSALNLFSATTNRRKCLKQCKSINRTANGANLLLSTTANKRIGLHFFRSPPAKVQIWCSKKTNRRQRIRAEMLEKKKKKIRRSIDQTSTEYYAFGEKCCAPKIACCDAGNQPREGCCAKRLF